MLNQNKGVFDGASPKMTFVFGFVTGLAVTSLLSVLLVFNVFGAGGIKVAKDDSGSPDNGGAADQNPTQGDIPDIVVPQITEDDHIWGNPEAEITIVEFSDYQCPFCARHHPTLQRLIEEYGDKVRWVYKHFPLTSLHPQAEPSAEASECVAALGGNDAFWAFSTELYNNNSVLGDELYASSAEKVGVDKAEFEECYSEGRYKDRVEKQYAEGIKAGITGTPGNLIIDKNGNAVPVNGAVPYEQFESIIDSLLGA